MSATRFITLFGNETQAGSPDRRLEQIHREAAATGIYRHISDYERFDGTVIGDPVFHRCYQNFDQAPNFYSHPAPICLRPRPLT